MSAEILQKFRELLKIPPGNHFLKDIWINFGKIFGMNPVKWLWQNDEKMSSAKTPRKIPAEVLRGTLVEIIAALINPSRNAGKNLGRTSGSKFQKKNL